VEAICNVTARLFRLLGNGIISIFGFPFVMKRSYSSVCYETETCVDSVCYETKECVDFVCYETETCVDSVCYETETCVDSVCYETE
jgi:hypothetical protein